MPAARTSFSSSPHSGLRSRTNASKFNEMRSEDDRRLEDTVTIATPEGVELELTLAGAGSRFVSALVDLTIQLVILLAAGIARCGQLGDAGAALLALVVVRRRARPTTSASRCSPSGRTPGKRMNGLRVVRSGGEPVGFVTSAIRNTLRLIDFLPFAYVVGAVTILATRKNQRLGDLAAGTLVVRERARPRPPRSVAAAAPAPVTVSWDTSAITADETAAVRRFLERRCRDRAPARRELARTFASRLRPKVAGAPAGLGDEEFLALLVAAKTLAGFRLARGPRTQPSSRKGSSMSETPSYSPTGGTGPPGPRSGFWRRFVALLVDGILLGIVYGISAGDLR